MTIDHALSRPPAYRTPPAHRMNLLTHYQQALAARKIEHDTGQLLALQHLEALKSALTAAPARGGLLARLRGRRPAAPTGLYLWGGVGRGKTWLMDLFFEALPAQGKLRLHFRHFMQQIHSELELLRGRREPLDQVAWHFARRARVLCLDEFYVEDITDAMILHRLLGGLLDQGLTLVFTSNLAPDQLYRNGLQRERFLPAIALIQRHHHIIHLDGDTDHRLGKLKHGRTYFTPVNLASEQAIRQCFEALAPGAIREHQPLEINQRRIDTLRCADDVVWFGFHQLCAGPRASADYIELARRYHTVFLSGVPLLGETEEEWAHRLVDLVDEFYDRKVKLIISAEAEPQHLYQGRRLRFEFQRTVSRLLEMRSEAYLAQGHRP